MSLLKAVKCRYLLIIFIVLAVGACASMPAPKTVNQKVAYTKATLEGLNDSVVQNLNANVISVEEAKSYRTKAKQVRSYLNVSERYIKLGEMALAEKSWEKANFILIELNKLLLEEVNKNASTN